MALVTNLIHNPRAEPGITPDTWPNNRWFGGGGAAGVWSYGAAPVGEVPVGTTFRRKTWTTAPTGTNGDTGFQVNYVGPGAVNGRAPVTPGSWYFLGGWLRATAPAGRKTATARVVFYTAAGVSTGGTGHGVWVRLDDPSWTWVGNAREAPADAAMVTLLLDVVGGGDTDVLWAPGDTLDGTGAQFEERTANGVHSPYLEGTRDVPVPRLEVWQSGHEVLARPTTFDGIEAVAVEAVP